MARDGHRAAQGLPVKINALPLATMLPQSGDGAEGPGRGTLKCPWQNGISDSEHGINDDGTLGIGKDFYKHDIK